MFGRRGVANVNDGRARCGRALCDLPQHWQRRGARPARTVRRPPLRAVNTPQAPPCPRPRPALRPADARARNAFAFYGRYYIMFLPAFLAALRHISTFLRPAPVRRSLHLGS